MLSKMQLAVLLGAAAVFLIQTPAVLAGGAPEVAHMRVTSSDISWQPIADDARISLRVKGPNGTFVQRVFQGGSDPTLPVIDDKGAPLPDGSYRYELMVEPEPDAALLEALQRAHEVGDSEAASDIGAALQNPASMGRVATQSGSFAIEAGQMVEVDQPRKHDHEPTSGHDQVH